MTQIKKLEQNLDDITTTIKSMENTLIDLSSRARTLEVTLGLREIKPKLDVEKLISEFQPAFDYVEITPDEFIAVNGGKDIIKKRDVATFLIKSELGYSVSDIMAVTQKLSSTIYSQINSGECKFKEFQNKKEKV